MSDDVVVRTADGADLGELQRVFAAASLSNAGDAEILRAHPDHLVFGGDHLAEGCTLVAVPADEPLLVLGFATLVPDETGDAELEDLFVDPQARRRGIARRLVAEAASRAGVGTIWVTGNEHALDFYRAVGFVVVGTAETPLRSAPRLRLDVDTSS